MSTLTTNQAVQAILANAAWRRILATFAKRYDSRAYVCGAHRIGDAEEATAIRGLLGGSPPSVGKLVHALRVDEALKASAAACSLEDLLHQLAGGQLTPRPLRKAQAEHAWSTEMRAILEDCPLAVRDEIRGWLDADHVQLRRFWRERPRDFPAAMVISARTLDLIRGSDPDSIPVIAERVGSNPHTLDPDRLAGRLLPRLLMFLEGAAGSPSGADERAELLRRHGLEIDDLSSLVTLSGLVGGHPLAEAAHRLGTHVVLTLAHLRDLGRTRINSASIWGVENVAVFRALDQRCRDLGAARTPCLVLTSGNPSLAVQRLVTHLLADDPERTLYYSGDNDPRGHEILRGFMGRHPGRVVPWGMTVEGLGRVPDRADTLWQEALIKHLWGCMLKSEGANGL